MPRGRGRIENRGQVSHPQRASSSRPPRPPSQPVRTQSALPTRRSTRIAERANRSRRANTITGSGNEGGMADIARRTDLLQRFDTHHRLRARQGRRGTGIPPRGSRRRRQAEQRPSASPPRNHQSQPYSRGQPPAYALAIITQPPSQLDSGVASPIPLTVSVHTVAEAHQQIELGVLWGVVSLSLVGPNEDAIPHEAGVLSGPRLVDSVRPIHDLSPELSAVSQQLQQQLIQLREGEREGTSSGVMSFPWLAIRDPGTYAIRVTLYRMGGSEGIASTAATSAWGGAVAVQAIDTGTITVS